MEENRGLRTWLAPAIAGAVLVGLAAGLVAITLRQPAVATYAPTAPAPADSGRGLVGPVVYTVDATATDRWIHFSFRLGSVLDQAGPRDWDLAFRRYQIIANGGAGFEGRGGAIDLGPMAFSTVYEVPEAGYRENEGRPDPQNPALVSWYHYGFFSHVLQPKPHVWAVRTADGRYAKLEIVGYYCPEARPGCLTFRYVYQGDGSAIVGRRG
jgi:hypothetical protein